jgi:hypothetical protein
VLCVVGAGLADVAQAIPERVPWHSAVAEANGSRH